MLAAPLLMVVSLFAGLTLPGANGRIPPLVLDICVATHQADRTAVLRAPRCDLPSNAAVWLTASPAAHAPEVPSVRSATSATRPVAFGTSTHGSPLTVERRKGHGPVQVTVMVIGVVHGQEDAGKGVVDHLRYLDIPAGVELVIVPTLNPDGEEVAAAQHADPYDTEGVHNGNGVNLNRNFPADWETGTYLTEGHYHSGPSPGSEVETQAFMRLAQAINPDVTVSFHQPWNSVDAAPGLWSAVRYAELVDMTVDYAHRPGTLTSWMNETGLGESFVVELGVDDPTSEEALRHAKALLTVATEYPKPPPEVRATATRPSLKRKAQEAITTPSDREHQPNAEREAGSRPSARQAKDISPVEVTPKPSTVSDGCDGE